MVYMLLADGFEEVEAFAPLDFLRRCGVAVETVCVSSLPAFASRGPIAVVPGITGAHDVSVEVDRVVSAVDFSHCEMLILPGGMPGTKNLDEYPQMTEILHTVYENGGYLAAICAAPMVLGKRGYLQGKEAICYPGFESYLEGATLSEMPVVVDGRVITARSAGVAWEFGYRLAEALVGTEQSEKVRKALFLPSFGA